ncbi:MAG: ferritin family protein [Ruminiclostridium sp.]
MQNYGNWLFPRNNMMNANMMNPNMMNTNKMNPNTMDPNKMNPNKMNPNIMNPDMMNPNKMNPNIMNPNIMNPDIMNPNIMNPDMMDPNIMNPDMMEPNKMNPNMMDHNENMMDMKHQNISPLSEALQLIKQAVEGETEDRLFYNYLIKNAASESDREIIGGIRDDEINHAKLFRQLYYEHTGKTIPPDVNVSFEPPKSYCEGLKRALIGETNAVKKYRRILFAMNNRRHINMLTEIITDELRHGILYAFVIHSNDCKY